LNKLFNEDDLSWIDKLADQDYLIIDDFFNKKELIEIDIFFNQQIESDNLIKAGIGATTYKIVKDVRGDFIFWLNESRDTTFAHFFNRIKEITFLLNRYCYLSISGK
jgi:SM-20-related protein